MPHAIALAKLARPRLEAVAPRPRLFRWLDRATRGSIAWIEGPPGSGKTTLVASWLERRRSAALWYRLDAADADVATFFHYLGRAARGLLPRRAALPAFRPGVGVDVPAFARGWFRALYEALPPSFTLVLDDHHELPAGAALQGLLAAALDDLPPRARAVVVSRSGPPPALARLRVAGRLELLAPDALRLTPAEAAAVARLRARGRRAPELAALHARTHGWAAGLTLLLASGSDATLPSAGASGLRDVFAYFAGEVLERADASTRRVLLETAVLPHVTPAAARELTGVPRADAILADLAHRAYFTARHGDRGAFTFHPLFRAFLLERGREALPPARLDEVRRAAARLLAADGEVGDAAALLRAAGAHDEVARLVLAHAQELLDQGRAEALRSMLLELPPALRDGDPWLQHWLGVSWLGFDIGAARAALARAHALFLERGDAAGAYLACAALLDSYAFEWVEFRSLQRWIDAFDELRRRWPAYPGPAVEARATCGIYTALMAARPDDPELPRWEARVTALATSAADPDLRARAAFALAHYAVWRGDLAGARAVLPGSPGPRGRIDPSLDAGLMVHAARAAFTSGDGAQALERVRAALALADGTGNHWWDFGARLVGVFAAALEGDAPAAQAFLRDLEHDFDPTLRAYYEQARGLVALRGGDRRAAREHLARALAWCEEAGAVYPQGWNEVALASLAHAAGDAEEARRRLAAAERLTELTRSHVLRYWTLGLGAAAAREPATGRRLATEALRCAAEHGPFADPWLDRRDLAALCARALEDGRELEAARALVARHRLEPPPESGSIDAWPREVSVRLLGAFELACAGAAPGDARREARPLLVLQALVALGGEDVPEWKLTEALWPDAEADAAQHALESNLHRLRRLLGTKHAVVQRERRLSLDPRACWADALALEAWLVHAPSAPAAADAPAIAERLLALYRGPFLPGEDAPWAKPMRDRLRRRVRALAAALGAALSRGGREGDARSLARELARRDPELDAAVAVRPVA